MGSRTIRSAVRGLAGAAALAAIAAVAGCAVPARVEAGSEVVVAVVGSVTSANPATSFGASRLNGEVAALTGSSFGHVDADGLVVADDFVGRADVIAEDPFTVRYTVADDAEWSDGIAIDGADLLLTWAASSHALDDPRIGDEIVPGEFVDPGTGRFAGFPDDVVYFDAQDAPGFGADSSASLDAGGRSVTVEYGAWFPGWQLAVQPTVPAHVAAQLASDDADLATDRAKRDVAEAIAAGSGARLAAISRVWNDAWNDVAGDDARLRVASGPYRLAEIEPGASATLVANARYHGARQPLVETIRLVSAPTAADAVAMVRDGAADVAAPEPSGDAARLAASLADGETGIAVETGVQSRLDIVQLRVSDGRHGTFGDPHARRAFLSAMPRDQIAQRVLGDMDAQAVMLESLVFQPRTPQYDASLRSNGSARYVAEDRGAARAELAESAVADPVVCVLYDPDDPLRVEAFEDVRSAAERVGFAVESCASPEWRTLLGQPGAWDAAIVDLPTAGDAAIDVGAAWRSDSPSNTSGYGSRELDALIDEVRDARDPADRIAALQRVDAALWSAAVAVPLYSPPSLAVVGPGVEGVSTSPLPASILWNAWAWRAVEVESSAPAAPEADG
jgi:peptide/nickel transport system substrate-binding protein